MPIVVNRKLYDEVKKEADQIYKKPSAYKSGWIVKTYKEKGGKYKNDHKKKTLKRWFKEKWGDIGGKEYPVYRPFTRISSETPLTVNEIDPQQARKQIKLKQKIKGKHNLPPFQPKTKQIRFFSDPQQAQARAEEYLGKNIKLHLSTKKNKKYMIQDPTGKWVHFGQFGMYDFTKHKDEARRQRYLKRATHIKGKWKKNPYSPNNLSIHVLW
jgi:hypothetical protein